MFASLSLSLKPRRATKACLVTILGVCSLPLLPPGPLGEELRVMDTQYPPPESPASSRSLHPGFPCSGGSRPPPGRCRPGMSEAMPTAFPSLAALSAGKREEDTPRLTGYEAKQSCRRGQIQSPEDLHGSRTGRQPRPGQTQAKTSSPCPSQGLDSLI